MKFPADAELRFNNFRDPPNATSVEELPIGPDNMTLYYWNFGGTDTASIRIDPRSSGGLPTFTKFDAHIHAGPAPVLAYDGSGAVVHEPEILGDTEVSIEATSIWYITIIGGDNENWLDNICIA